MPYLQRSSLPSKGEDGLSFDGKRQIDRERDVPRLWVIPYRALTFSMLIFSGKTVMQR